MNNDWQKRIRDFIGVPPEVDLTGHDCCTMCGQPTRKAPQVDELIGMISEELDNREAEVREKHLEILEGCQIVPEDIARGGEWARGFNEGLNDAGEKISGKKTIKIVNPSKPA